MSEIHHIVKTKSTHLKRRRRFVRKSNIIFTKDCNNEVHTPL